MKFILNHYITTCYIYERFSSSDTSTYKSSGVIIPSKLWARGVARNPSVQRL